MSVSAWLWEIRGKSNGTAAFLVRGGSTNQPDEGQLTCFHLSFDDSILSSEPYGPSLPKNQAWPSSTSLINWAQISDQTTFSPFYLFSDARVTLGSFRLRISPKKIWKTLDILTAIRLWAPKDAFVSYLDRESCQNQNVVPCFNLNKTKVNKTRLWKKGSYAQKSDNSDRRRLLKPQGCTEATTTWYKEYFYKDSCPAASVQLQTDITLLLIIVAKD